MLLIVDAESVDEIHRRLADDPWVSTEQLRAGEHTRSTDPNSPVLETRRVFRPDRAPQYESLGRPT